MWRASRRIWRRTQETRKSLYPRTLGTNIDLNSLNLNELVGWENEHSSFRIGTKIVQNGLAITNKALIDTGANGFAFILYRHLVRDPHRKIFWIEYDSPRDTLCSTRIRRQERELDHPCDRPEPLDWRTKAVECSYAHRGFGKHDIVFGQGSVAYYQTVPRIAC
jgi:hypothetical protein